MEAMRHASGKGGGETNETDTRQGFRGSLIREHVPQKKTLSSLTGNKGCYCACASVGRKHGGQTRREKIQTERKKGVQRGREDSTGKSARERAPGREEGQRE